MIPEFGRIVEVLEGLHVEALDREAIITLWVRVIQQAERLVQEGHPVKAQMRHGLEAGEQVDRLRAWVGPRAANQLRSIFIDATERIYSTYTTSNTVSNPGYRIV